MKFITMKLSLKEGCNMEKFLKGLSEQVKEKIQRFNHEISEHDEQEIIFKQVFDVLQGLESDFDSLIEENELFVVIFLIRLDLIMILCCIIIVLLKV